MKGDFSRLTFDRAHPFSRVLMQQGRVLLDSDWNELNAVLLHYLRRLAADLIGPHGGPEEMLGFELDHTTPNDFTIHPGRYYVDGLLVELESADDGSEGPVTYLHQPHFPDPPKLPGTFPYLVYLDVWERHVTAVEHDDIREKALGGPDTSSRAQIVWQVRVTTNTDFFEADTLSCQYFELAEFRRTLEGRRPMLRARALRPPDADTDPCLTPPQARYRGIENQLYRVEIHTPGSVANGGEPTFKWSRENGSVVTRWVETRGKDLVVKPMRDEVLGFKLGDWIEILDDRREFGGGLGTLARLSRVEGDVLSVDENEVHGDIGGDPSTLRNPRARRWDHRELTDHPLVKGAVPITEGTGDDHWLPLENGIEIQFQAFGAGEEPSYRTGDYWLIPARVASGDVEWPRDPSDPSLPAAVPPHGIEHHYAPLMLFGTNAVDLRMRWDHLARCPPST